jgi:hypothetical protein
MVRISRLTATLAAVMMTALAFGAIGISSNAHSDLHSITTVGSRVSAAVNDTAALMRQVLARFV